MMEGGERERERMGMWREARDVNEHRGTEKGKGGKWRTDRGRITNIQYDKAKANGCEHYRKERNYKPGKETERNGRGAAKNKDQKKPSKEHEIGMGR